MVDIVLRRLRHLLVQLVGSRCVMIDKYGLIMYLEGKKGENAVAQSANDLIWVPRTILRLLPEVIVLRIAAI